MKAHTKAYIDKLTELVRKRDEIETQIEELVSGVSSVETTSVRKTRRKPSRANHNRKWTTDEERFIFENFPKSTIREISKKLGRSPIAVKIRLRKIGLEQAKATKASAEVPVEAPAKDPFRF